MTWAGLDQRAFPRFSTRCDITISDGGETLKTYTQNIGIGGVCVILKKELQKLSQVKLRLLLNESLPPITCNARVVWMIRSKEPSLPKPNYDVGLEFLNLDPQDQERIQSFVQKLNQ